MSKHLTNEFKIMVVEKALTRPEQTILSDIAQQYGIGKSTLSRWMNEVKQGKLTTNKTEVTQEKRPADWTLEEKQQVLQASHGLSEQELGRYCREQGIYHHHLAQWKQELMSQPKDDKLKQYKANIRELKNENKQLQRELRRKEKALAEAAAIIILKKKAQALFNQDEEN